MRPRGGKTLSGTPVRQRTPECFPAEARDLFWQMDMVPDENLPGHPLRPLNFDRNGDGVIDDQERKAIQGRNSVGCFGVPATVKDSGTGCHKMVMG